MSSLRRNLSRARCHHIDCDKFAQTKGLCKAHGGGTRCRELNCHKLAQSRGLCIAHGGGRRCQEENCQKLAQSKGFCISHGGGRRCNLTNCKKFAQVKGRCKAHSRLIEVQSHAQQPIETKPCSPLTMKLSIDYLVHSCDSINEDSPTIGSLPPMTQFVLPTERISRRYSVEEVVNPFQRVPDMKPCDDIHRLALQPTAHPETSFLDPKHETIQLQSITINSTERVLPIPRSLLSFLETHQSKLPVVTTSMLMPPLFPQRMLPRLDQLH